MMALPGNPQANQVAQDEFGITRHWDADAGIWRRGRPGQYNQVTGPIRSGATVSETARRGTSSGPTTPTTNGVQDALDAAREAAEQARLAAEAQAKAAAEAQARWEQDRVRQAAERAQQFTAEIQAAFPWLQEIGIDISEVHKLAAEASGPDEIVVGLRQMPQFRARFPGMYRADGTVRMNEAQYMAREQDYRTLLRQYGFDPTEYETPSSLIGFFGSEMDPNELEQRLGTYREVERASQTQKDAFYVYAGLDVSTDDLYEATVDPAAHQRLADEYNRAIAAGQFDYQTWITRATEVGLRRVADTLTTLSNRGAVTSAAIQATLSVAPDFARQMMDAIYTGGDPGDPSAGLELQDLLSSFEYALVGAAAQNAGLEMPTRERLAEIRAAGVTRQQQIDAYTQFGQNEQIFDAASRRAGYGGMTTTEFEDAAFFNEADASQELRASLAREEAAGRDSGEFRFAEDRGRLVQRGLRPT